MKKYLLKCMFTLAVILMAVNFTSCSDDGDDDGPAVENKDEAYGNILKSYVNTTVIPTYKALAEAALEMRVANQALKENATDANMEKAAAAWIKARIQWELSEAFLFGPVSEDHLNIDAHIDSWPLELEEIKKEIGLTEGRLTGERAWKELEDEVIGFHVTEYLLYREGKARPVAELTEGELNYLTAATDALVWDCVLAYVAWAGEENVSAAIKDVYHENADIVSFLESENASIKNFGSKLSSADSYSSWESAVEEIIDGAIDIADEVGATKIADPYSNGRVEDVESWYSWHSLDDYTNNIYSIRNAYLGGEGMAGSPTSVSLSTFVKENDAALDTEIKEKIEDCIKKIQAIGDNGSLSFYKVVEAKSKGDASRQAIVDAAVDACSAVGDSFGKIKELLK
ncbi:MAG: hypothetical protein LBF62_00960 [Tannerellaceae bacterium]|jgi:uncharacterized iron-regulated protein|nr:hypothetical protein [Tannerellaceae bacterium]